MGHTVAIKPRALDLSCTTLLLTHPPASPQLLSSLLLPTSPAVAWRAPQAGDYYLFAQAMQLAPERKTLLHCQANFRASSFALLYRVLELGVPLAQAKTDMNKVWTPNSIWTQFILDVLKDNDVDPNCSGCDWTPSTIGE